MFVCESNINILDVDVGKMQEVDVIRDGGGRSSLGGGAM